MELIAEEIIPLFKPGDVVVLDPKFNPNRNQLLVRNDIHRDTAYIVWDTFFSSGKAKLKLRRDDGGVTDELPAQKFVPK